MKKKSTSDKAYYFRFILLLILTLIIGNEAFAQCTEVIPGSCSSCNSDLNIKPTCLTCYSQTMLTDLESKGAGPTSSLTISASTIVGVSSVKAESINVYNSACAFFGGPFVSTTFNALGSGITFQDFNDHITISVTGNTSSFVGFTANFKVNVYDAGNNLIASRNYFFKGRSDNLIVGDTHITTVDGGKFDFQAVGEFVALQADGADNLQIQVRQTAVATAGPGTDPHTGLSTCVSVNTAVAAQVGKHRVTYQPNINGKPDSSGLQLRVDGKLTELAGNGLDFGDGGRVQKSAAGGGAIQIDFPDGAALFVTPGWWSPYNQWYLNVSVNNTTATKGISGALAFNDTIRGSFDRSKSWLPAMPDGSSLGSMPESMHERFVTLYKTFADAWRVTDQTSLFDYASGTSTASFTNKDWPAENAVACSVPGQNPKAFILRAVAEQLAAGIVDPNLKEYAIYDVMFTGEPSFVNTYLLTQKIQTSTTAIRVNVSRDTIKSGDSVTFSAIVAPRFLTSKEVLTGSVEFTVDGKKLAQVNLDANGRAELTTTSLEKGEHKIAAKFIPGGGSTAFSSVSFDVTLIVTGGSMHLLHQWWFWAAIIILILLVVWVVKRKKNP